MKIQKYKPVYVSDQSRAGARRLTGNGTAASICPRWVGGSRICLICVFMYFYR